MASKTMFQDKHPRSLMSDAVLQNAPSLSNWNGVVHNSSLIDWGQRGHGLNESGYGSWPYILAFEFPSDLHLSNMVQSAINVEYGNTDDLTSISLGNQSPADETHLYLTITDPALNIDPTSADANGHSIYLQFMLVQMHCISLVITPIQTVEMHAITLARTWRQWDCSD